jgi:SulP family sulfate permease
MTRVHALMFRLLAALALLLGTDGFKQTSLAVTKREALQNEGQALDAGLVADAAGDAGGRSGLQKPARQSPTNTSSGTDNTTDGTIHIDRPNLSLRWTIPINSAGQHTGRRQTIDVILLFVALSVPFILYAFIRIWEARQAAREEKLTKLDASMTAKGNDGGRPRGRSGSMERIGSTYHMEDNNDANYIGITAAMGPMKSDERPGKDEGTILTNILAGFSTAMAALPDAISFSFITGVSPLNGIWAGTFMGLSAALVGGRPGMISSASAATAVVLAQISTNRSLGMGPMALCVFLVGIIQIFCGMLRLSRFITLVPHSVMLGFVNGLAIVMIRAQIRQFHEQGDGPWVERDIAVGMVITAAVAIVAAVAWKRIPVVSRYLPAPLASLIVTFVFSVIVQDLIPRRSLRMVAGHSTFQGGLSTMPSWDFPPAGVDYASGYMWRMVISIAVRFAIVGLLESLMTQALIDQITNTTGSMRRECFGQGVGNILSSLFGTQGGCALIAQSLLNVSSGGHSRVSGVTMGITLFLSVVALAPIMGEIPVAALVGLIVLIALNTFAWSSLSLILRINWVDSIVVVVVTVVTVWKDLCVAVIIGVVICGLGFAWTTASHCELKIRSDGDKKVISMHGPLFFGSAMNFQQDVTKARVNEDTLVLDFSNARILDISATDAVAKCHEYWVGQGKKVVLRSIPADAKRHLPQDCEYDDVDDIVV